MQVSTHHEKKGKEFKGGKIHEHRENLQNGITMWSSCISGTGHLLNIEDRLSLHSNNKSAEGEVSKDDATFGFQHKLDINWRRCKNGDGGKGKKGGSRGVLV
jgi:hypothetical protein